MERTESNAIPKQHTHTLRKRGSQRGLAIHIHVCVCVCRYVRIAVCRVTYTYTTRRGIMAVSLGASSIVPRKEYLRVSKRQTKGRRKRVSPLATFTLLFITRRQTHTHVCVYMTFNNADDSARTHTHTQRQKHIHIIRTHRDATRPCVVVRVTSHFVGRVRAGNISSYRRA